MQSPANPLFSPLTPARAHLFNPDAGSPDLVRLISICILTYICAKKTPSREKTYKSETRLGNLPRYNQSRKDQYLQVLSLTICDFAFNHYEPRMVEKEVSLYKMIVNIRWKKSD